MKLINKYKSQVFDLINECYIPLYGAVPITPILKDKLINTFKFLILLDFISIIVDKNDKVVGLGVAIPGIAKGLNKSKGRLLSLRAFRIAKDFIKPNYAEIFMICVHLSNFSSVLFHRSTIELFTKRSNNLELLSSITKTLLLKVSLVC